MEDEPKDLRVLSMPLPPKTDIEALIHTEENHQEELQGGTDQPTADDEVY